MHGPLPCWKSGPFELIYRSNLSQVFERYEWNFSIRRRAMLKNRSRESILSLYRTSYKLVRFVFVSNVTNSAHTYAWRDPKSRIERLPETIRITRVINFLSLDSVSRADSTFSRAAWNRFRDTDPCNGYRKQRMYIVRSKLWPFTIYVTISVGFYFIYTDTFV